VLQRGGLAQQRGAEGRRRGEAERERRHPRLARQLVHDQLRPERRPRVPRPGRDDQPQRRERPTTRGGDVRGGDERAERAEHEPEGERPRVRVAPPGRGPGDPDDAEHEAAAADELPRPDPLVQHPRGQHEQQHDAEGDDRLDERERGERERRELQRPAERRQRHRAEPEPPPRESGEQRHLDGAVEPDPPRLERLQRVRDLVAGGRRRGCEGAQRDVARHRCDDAPMRARTLAALGAAGAAAAWSAPAAAPFAPPVARRLHIPTRLPRPRGVALTFDDGPHPEGTPAVLEALARAGATATFFLVGEQVERNPALAAEIAAAGHEVALHGHRHRLHLLRSPGALEDDLRRGAAAVEDAVGTTTAWYRPPYGVFSPASLGLVRRSGRQPILWSRWGRDWGARATPEAIASRATEGLRGGDVVLLHDADHYSSVGSWSRTAAALPAILESVLALGEPLVVLTQST
jgi:peptidoglycan/xylan/chitin deacetylase (PgdA/CDA1 family)